MEMILKNTDVLIKQDYEIVFNYNLVNRFIAYTDVTDATIKGYITYIKQFIRYLLNKNINLESYLNAKVEMAPEAPKPIEPPVEDNLEEDIKDEEEIVEDTTTLPVIEDKKEVENEEEAVIEEEIKTYEKEENNVQVTVENIEIKDNQLSNIIVNDEKEDKEEKKYLQAN